MKWIVSPLFTHWRHESVSSGREGCHSPDSEHPIDILHSPNNNTTIPNSAVFCSFDTNLEKLLVDLHLNMRTGNRKYQSEIDRYLVACSDENLRHLILPRGNAPHYDNLPDFSFYALSILDPSKDGVPELQQIFLLLRQCTPLRRRTKRAQRELQWESCSLQGMQHLVISMQGTLLGLYPSCARSVAFVTRVQIYRFIRSMLVADFHLLNLCLQKIRYILKISVMEHLCNTIVDYHPGIRHMLNKSGQQLQHFFNAVTTMCDIFRGEMNTLFLKTNCILSSMLQMEKSAHSFFERCTRAYRGIITNHSSSFSSLEILRKRGLSPSIEFLSHLKRIHIAQSQYIFELVHKDLQIPADYIEMFWHLTQCITVQSLPDVIRARQYQALCRRYPEDSICIERCRRIYVCVYCSIRRNITGGQQQCAKIRKDCTNNGILLCANCNIPSILNLDILGRIAIVGDQKILLSCCCASLIYYKGSGYEYNIVCGEQCARQNQFSKGKFPCSSSSLPTTIRHTTTRGKTAQCLSDSMGRYGGGAKRSAANRPHCYICRQKNVVHTFELLDVAARGLVQYHLCSKHNLSSDLVNCLGDEQDLIRALKCNKKI
jgi:hypothetical protein